MQKRPQDWIRRRQAQADPADRPPGPLSPGRFCAMLRAAVADRDTPKRAAYSRSSAISYDERVNSPVRLSDTSPKDAKKRLQVPLAPPSRAPRKVLTWPVTPTSRCHVRRADITGQSHFQLVPRLALDTRRRNRHASHQA